ncbi:MAG TPA: hypothetical protein VLW51_01045 [Solirubrobacteraceae bacterium]|nr:hypothetical protein [Solirubrobacteraceae bacterium]
MRAPDGACGCGRPRHVYGVLDIPGPVQPYVGALERIRQLAGRLADQVHRTAAGGHQGRQWREVLALSSAAGDQMDPARERLQRDDRAGDVGRLGIVDPGDAVLDRDPLQAVADPGECAQAGHDRLGVDPAREACRGGGHRVLNVVSPRQREFVDP